MELTNTEPTLDVHAPERAVFVTDDNRRARRLRRGTFAAASLAVLWLVGLGVGMFGLGGLPGISLGKQGGDGAGQAQPAPSPAKLSPIARTLTPLQSRGRVVARPVRQGAGSQSHSVGNPARPVSPVTPPPVAGGAPQQPANPAQHQRGWARKGNPAPPGQVRKAQPKPPAGSRGQRRGQTTTTTTTTTTPLPPGQAKKAPPPIPPPSEG
jgi:hypothetical protein